MNRLLVLLFLLAMLVAVPTRAQEDDESEAPATVESPSQLVPPTASPTAAAVQSFVDDFDNPDIARLPRSSPEPEHYGRGYLDGEYAIQVYDAAWMGAPGVGIPGVYSDVLVSIDARAIGSPGSRGVALQCRTQAGFAYRGLLDVQGGQARLVRAEPSAQVILQDWVRVDGFRRGGESNRFQLGCAADSIVLIVNGSPLFGVSDGTLTQGTTSFGISGANGAADLRFDNLVVRSINAPDLPTPPVLPTATPRPAPGAYEGTWSGMTNQDRRPFSLIVDRNRVTSVTIDYSVAGNSCSADGPMLTLRANPPAEIVNGAFSSVAVPGRVRFTRDGEPGLRTMSFSVTGQFRSDNTATGTVDIRFEGQLERESTPSCAGATQVTWTARR